MRRDADLQLAHRRANLQLQWKDIDRWLRWLDMHVFTAHWKQAWPDRSQREIAKQIGCSQQYVQKLRVQVSARSWRTMRPPSRSTSYNFARIHRTLRVTLAMAAGVSDHVWGLEEIVGLLDAADKKAA